MNKKLRMFGVVLLSGTILAACSDMSIDYEIRSGQAFSDIQGSYSNKDSAVYHGYMYYFSTYPVFFDKPWDTSTLHAPAALNGGNDMLQCYVHKDGWRVTLNFYCGGEVTSPAKPPEGNYQVNVGSKTYNFNGVTSRLIDSSLNNVFVPEIRLTMDGSGKISQIDWRWWKKQSGSWVTPSASDLTAALDNAGFEISTSGWAGDRVNGTIALTPTGSVTPPAQGFTPGAIRVGYGDKDGYNYGFEWR